MKRHAWGSTGLSTAPKTHLRPKGMIYGLQFPWTEDMLLSSKFGAEWLTQAMHVAGTLPKERVVGF